VAITRKELLILLKLRQIEKLLLQEIIVEFKIYKKVKRPIDKAIVKQHMLLLYAIDMLKTLDHNATGVIPQRDELENLLEEDYVLYTHKGEKNDNNNNNK